MIEHSVADAPAAGARSASPAHVAALIAELRRAYPDATCALTHQDPFQLLVATILSAQCTDARVNMVTPVLFAAYADAAAMSRASQEELEGIIRSTGFYRNKAKSIRAASARIVDAFGGRVPRTMEELLTLPGVARKTANVVLGAGYGIAVGVVVDTHVDRLAHRLGLSDGKNPEAIEQDLMRVVPREDWIDLSHLLIFHGRQVCQARKPECGSCPVAALCPSAPYYLAGKEPPARGSKAMARERAARKGGTKKPPVKKKPHVKKTAVKKTAVTKKPAATKKAKKK
ncbi:MAG TPA: endonuclease III [Candidatus Eisenbacteria bacterium]|nr:endonuclease III [Candidatus Eisenbacteria bacterium]